MNIVFYSTNSNFFKPGNFEYFKYPSPSRELQELKQTHPDFNFYIVTQEPGTFLLDHDTIHEESCEAKSNNTLLCDDSDAGAFAEKILSYSPDMAIAVTFWEPPFDWHSIKDALVAEILKEHGVKVLCHPLETAADCYDKAHTRSRLEEIGFKLPNSIYINREQLWAERRFREIRSNVYKEYILHELAKLHFPVVIKDTVGLSSYSTEVARTYNEAKAYILSGRTDSDRIVEEYIEGQHFGLEIEGTPGNYTVYPPFLFSLNRYGITSPKQSVKIGPVQSEKFNINTLSAMMTKLAEAMAFEGIAQVDLIYSKGEWNIIEINPRISGLTETYCAAIGKGIFRRLLDCALRKNTECEKYDYICNFKFPLLTQERLEKLCAKKQVAYVNQTRNCLSRQERDKGYAELIFGKAQSLEELASTIESLAAEEADIIEPVFLENARKLIEELKAF